MMPLNQGKEEADLGLQEEETSETKSALNVVIVDTSLMTAETIEERHTGVVTQEVIVVVEVENTRKDQDQGIDITKKDIVIDLAHLLLPLTERKDLKRKEAFLVNQDPTPQGRHLIQA
jgi:hypothetical protein